MYSSSYYFQYTFNFVMDIIFIDQKNSIELICMYDNSIIVICIYLCIYLLFVSFFVPNLMIFMTIPNNLYFFIFRDFDSQDHTIQQVDFQFSIILYNNSSFQSILGLTFSISYFTLFSHLILAFQVVLFLMMHSPVLFSAMILLYAKNDLPT